MLWVVLCTVLAAGAIFGAALDAARLDWQPSRAWSEPWRWWSAAFVHGSMRHLAANLVATGLVAAYGWAAGARPALAVAWLVAWPITHGALLARPELVHYGGLSGVLHAGVAAVTVQLLMRGDRRQRRIGLAMAVGQGLKLLLEQPWGALLHPPGLLGVAVAPLAHANGTLAGAACAVLALARTRKRSP